MTWPPSGRVTLGLLAGLEYAEDAEDVLRMDELAGYDTCHCLGAVYCFTAFMHIIYNCCLLGGMRVHLNFLG